MRIRPTMARIAPRLIHGRWSIMKLEAGQWTRPLPWPIHSNPINTAATPMISKADFIADWFSSEKLFPCIAKEALSDAAKQHCALARTIIGHRRKGSRARTYVLTLRPVFSVPFPSILE